MNYIILNDNEWSTLTGWDIQEMKDDGSDYVIIINDDIYDKTINIKDCY